MPFSHRPKNYVSKVVSTRRSKATKEKKNKQNSHMRIGEERRV
jgi:hypothetical protein